MSYLKLYSDHTKALQVGNIEGIQRSHILKEASVEKTYPHQAMTSKSAIFTGGTEDISKYPQEDEKWRKNVSWRIKRVEFLMMITLPLVLVLLTDKMWNFAQHKMVSLDSTIHMPKQKKKKFPKIPVKKFIAPSQDDTTLVLKSRNRPPAGSDREKRKGKVIFEQQSAHELTNIGDYTHSTNSQSMARRRLQLKNSPCDGTLFQLELFLDEKSDDTSWHLIDEQKQTIVAHEQYTESDKWSKKALQMCLEPGLYRFSLFDTSGDGIRCEETMGCYSIHVDGQDLRTSLFSGEAVEHLFDSSSPCIAHRPITIFSNQIDSAQWELRDAVSNEIIQPHSNPEENAKLTNTHFSCLPPGIYTVTMRSDESLDPCINVTDCFRIQAEGELFAQVDKESTSSFSVLYDGNLLQRRCHQSPALSASNHANNFIFDQRVESVMSIIHGLSSNELLNDKDSHQYRAACWVIYDDPIKITTEDQFLIERYILALLLYSMNQDAELILSMNTCDYDKVSCDENGFIKKVDFFGFGLEGTIPSDISHLRHLESLELHSNQFGGTIPLELGRLSKMKTLDLFDNNLVGSIPSDLGKMILLENFRLNNNQLTGSIPNKIGHYTQLKFFDLSDNLLSGTIPEELFDCKKLERMRLHNNRFSGTIPNNIEQLHDLETLILSVNDLEGKIPHVISGLSSVRFVDLGFNKLTGQIPSEIGLLDNLEGLDVNNNHLNGTLPNIFGNFTKLRELRLSHNHFSGEVPEDLWRLPLLKRLFLEDNNLMGKVPLDVCGEMEILELDDSPWYKDKASMICPCCDSEVFSHMWDVSATVVGGARRTTCPEDNIIEISYLDEYKVIDRLANAELNGEDLSRNIGKRSKSTVGICISPSGCYTIQAGTGVTSQMKMESKSLGYSTLTNKLEESQCDEVRICDFVFDSGHPKRNGLNHLTQLVLPDLSFLEDPSSSEYKALCWIMTEDPVFFAFSINDGTLLQRMVLALFFHTFEQSYDFSTFSSQPTCQWPGVTCDETNKFVREISVDGTVEGSKLSGPIITELGLLTKLTKIDFSDNELHGTLDPIIFDYLPELQEFNVGENELSGELPTDLFQLPNLKKIILANNTFVGSLPDGFEYPQSLEYFDFENNLLQGEIPEALNACQKIEVLNLAQNGLSGTIPSNFGTYDNLRVLKLHQNRLFGSIPTEIFNPVKIEVLMMQTNELTGSIPTQIGKLERAVNITMNHNALKGKIPSELENLTNIEFLHLHQNLLTGRAPELKFPNAQKNSFITDCGFPSHSLDSPLQCKSCTMCCNIDDLCQQSKSWEFPIFLIATLFAVMVPIGAATINIAITETNVQTLFSWFVDDRDPLTLYSEDSIYCFILSKSKRAIAAYLFTSSVQIWLFVLYLQASNVESNDSDYKFTFRCLDNSMDCKDEVSFGINGWILFVTVTLLYLGADISMSLLQLRKAVMLLDFQLLISGFGLLGLTALAFFTSFVYNMALAEKNTDLLTNAVILLFINDLDEKFLSMIRLTFPNWTSERLDEVKKNMKRKTHNNPGDIEYEMPDKPQYYPIDLNSRFPPKDDDPPIGLGIDTSRNKRYIGLEKDMPASINPRYLGMEVDMPEQQKDRRYSINADFLAKSTKSMRTETESSSATKSRRSEAESSSATKSKGNETNLILSADSAFSEMEIDEINLSMQDSLRSDGDMSDTDEVDMDLPDHKHKIENDPNSPERNIKYRKQVSGRLDMGRKMLGMDFDL